MLSTELSGVTKVNGKCQGALPPTKLLRKETKSLDTTRDREVSALPEAVKPQCYKGVESLHD